MVALTSLSHGAGCGCKLPAAALGPLLSRLPRVANPNVLVGFDTSDDAGVVRVRDDLAIVTTADFFTPIVDDPFDFGRIAATNALSDIYAMGASPVSALNLVAFSLDALGGEVLLEILRGAAAVVTNAGGRVGDAVVLTKPLGAGAVSTALKRGNASVPPAESVGVMTTLNRDGAAAALAAGVRAWPGGGTGMTALPGSGRRGTFPGRARRGGVGAGVAPRRGPGLKAW